MTSQLIGLMSAGVTIKISTNAVDLHSSHCHWIQFEDRVGILRPASFLVMNVHTFPRYL